ncbi:hypothetical protein PVAP13_9KG488200 [Panicum virgatum]|uniref:Uncharacterized protein n=1 Tax=Panicum virgatum TaxID=38727 RepID=A0A8T0NWM8_PANVG|nr:hypothetical protein PVAP13_9KG488200 [Panicum virgatum]
MSRDHAKWDDRKLSLMLDLVAKLKELCHWADKGPTSIGWTTIYRPFNELKRVYFNWRDGHKHTGLGRDPETDEVAVDPVWCAAVHGESSKPAGEKYKRPSFCEQLFLLFGHTPRDRGELFSAGGHGTDQTSSGDSPRTPQDLSNEPVRS